MNRSTSRPPFALEVSVQVVVRRSDDPRPVAYRLGRLTLTDADRFRWRSRVANLLADVVRVLRTSEAATRFDARYSAPVDPPGDEPTQEGP